MSMFRTSLTHQSFSVKSFILVSKWQEAFGGCCSRVITVSNYCQFVSWSAYNFSTSFNTQPPGTGSQCGAHGVWKNQRPLSDGTRTPVSALYKFTTRAAGRGVEAENQETRAGLVVEDTQVIR